MPERRDRSSVCGNCNGRPRPRLVPPATSSSGSSAASAAAIASRNSLKSAGVKQAIGDRVSPPAPSSNRALSCGNGKEEAGLEARQIGVRLAAGVHVQATELGAAIQLREHLAGVEQPVRIEGAFEALLLVEIGLGEHDAHQIALLDPDPVLAGQDAADRDAQSEDVGAERFGALGLARLVGIIKNERV